ncbi:MAG: hypothetical protein F6K50_37395 [Moorea sp. SIO3I7]|nr:MULTISPECIES: hypothetical protein [Moorena]NEO00897.1 hypothetical protein [Moorena sp. SIO3I7]NEO10697.1 hypothetical protein [Moorena sp. SIO3I8]NEO44557.1 hypothetical protein [Moorena sp. SIO4A3]NEO59931.1 hypothetical protein [Moorena sp. SIO4G2]NEP29675.1 hypothetical protein [Moorena sp. SIO3I6]NEQ87454.1 hypothetical protein [Moorena sp. SIO2I5]
MVTLRERDINGARGIFLRALGDTPWLRDSAKPTLREQLALAGNGLSW